MKLSMRLRLALVVLPGVLATVFFVAPAHAAFPGFLIKSGDPAHAGECAAANTDTSLTDVGVVATRPCNSLDPTQQWTYNANNAQELRVMSGAFAGRCADTTIWAGGAKYPVVYMKPCNGSVNQAWNQDASQHISGVYTSPLKEQYVSCWGPETLYSETVQVTSCSTTVNAAQMWIIVSV